MRHLASSSFWACHDNLPPSVKKLAAKNFDLLKENIRHPSLHTKKVGQFWSVRIGKSYRALATEVEDGLLWFWIGTHSEYDQLL
jgi:hypothetical protein